MGLFRRSRPQASPPAPPKRRGLYETVFIGQGLLNKGMQYNVIAEVTELDRIGNVSKLQVDEISGVEKSFRKQFAEQIEGWKPTSHVSWREVTCPTCGASSGTPCDAALHS